MTIAPITGIMDAGLAGMPNIPAPAAKESDKGDFMQTFQSAKDAQEAPQPVKTEGTGAKGKESDTEQAQVGQQAPKKENDVQKNDQQAVKNDKPATDKTEKAEAADKPVAETAVTESEPEADEIVMETLAANVAQLLQDILELLGGTDMQELTDVFSRLDLSAEDLLQPGSANLLVAEFMGDGDLAALVTDSNLSDIAGKINELIGEALEEVKELLPEAEPQQILAPVIREELSTAIEERPAAASVEHLTSDAIAAPVAEEQPAEQTVVTVSNEKQQDTKEEGRETKDSRHTAREDFREEQTVFTPDTVAAETVLPDAEEVRTEAEMLRYASEPQQILDQVADQIKTQVKDDMSSLEMVLHPASLGNVALNLTSKDGSVTAQFTAQSEAVKEALESQLVVLRQNLEQAGVKVTAVEVTVSSHAFEQNLEQGNDGQSDAEAKEQERLRRATRKIDLGGEGEGDTDVDDADAVTVEMMQADGNRMDYRA